jgi:mannose-6-phosphate isomerase-like protein (cupin superfamily)
MKASLFRVLCLGVFVVCASVAFAQTANTDFHSQAELAERSQQLIARAMKNAKGSGNSTLGKYANHEVQFNVKTKSGISEMHAHLSDFIIVTDGEATIVTGGTIPDSRLESEGETRGVTITGGHEQKVAKGDVVYIAPNTPHQILIVPGKTVTFLNVKVTQP